jgi:molecular chaperone DnaK
MPQIEVAFDIDANGIVNVSAKDQATGKEQAMQITGGTALGKEEIDRMMAEAEKFSEEDHKRREAAEVRNNAENLAYQAEKTVGELGEKVAAEDKEAVEKAVADVKGALEGEDTDAIRAATDTLMQAFQKVGQAVYQQQESQQQAPGDAASGGAEDVVEGEVVDEGGAS